MRTDRPVVMPSVNRGRQALLGLLAAALFAGGTAACQTDGSPDGGGGVDSGPHEDPNTPTDTPFVQPTFIPSDQPEPSAS